MAATIAADLISKVNAQKAKEVKEAREVKEAKAAQRGAKDTMVKDTPRIKPIACKIGQNPQVSGGPHQQKIKNRIGWALYHTYE